MTVEARSSRVRPDRQELIRLRTLLPDSQTDRYLAILSRTRPEEEGGSIKSERPRKSHGPEWAEQSRRGSHDRRSAKLSN